MGCFLESLQIAEVCVSGAPSVSSLITGTQSPGKRCIMLRTTLQDGQSSGALLVAYQIAALLWGGKEDPLLRDRLYLALDQYLHRTDGSGLTDVALGVLDAFRTASEPDPGPDFASVGVGSADGADAVGGVDLPSWLNSSDQTMGAALGMMPGHSSGDWSEWSLSAKSTCTSLSSSASTLEETGESCESALTEPATSVPMASVKGEHGDCGEKRGLNLTWGHV